MPGTEIFRCMKKTRFLPPEDFRYPQKYEHTQDAAGELTVGTSSAAGYGVDARKRMLQRFAIRKRSKLQLSMSVDASDLNQSRQ